MQVYKFGGASVKDPEGVTNLCRIVGQQSEPLIVVVSAMGKMTNLLEELCRFWFYGENTEQIRKITKQFQTYHWAIVKQLFPDNAPIYPLLEEWFEKLDQLLEEAPSLCYDFEYDRIISFGELVSTQIISAHLAQESIPNQWVDIRKCLITDQHYRNANVDPEISEKLCRETFQFHHSRVYVTQGFIAGTRTGQTTTLGREGSDYTAALLANLLNAESVTIWKDVPGIMNADPKEYAHAVVMERISYKEAIELSHSGAKVIHPKTIKPLQNKQIPLFVKSFLYPRITGTVIREIDERLTLPPVLIHKENQLLLTLTPRDFSFIAEEKLSHIFAVLARYNLKLNLMQNSAISFSFCIDHHPAIFEDFIRELQTEYEVLYNQNVQLITIRHYTEEFIREILGDRPVLVEQRSRIAAQFVILF